MSAVSAVCGAGLERTAPQIPAAATLAKDLVARRRHRNRVLELDEPALRMLHRGLDRHHHPCFERQPGVGVIVGDWAFGGQARGLMADEAHAVGQKLPAVTLADLRELPFRPDIDVAAMAPGRTAAKAARWTASI